LTPIKLSIVVAVQHAQSNVPDIMRALRPECHHEVEYLICHTPADPDVSSLVGDQDNIRVLCSPAGSLIPHLWRDGILAAQGARVATTTAHCIPDPDWMAGALDHCPDNTVLGGVITNDVKADAKARAIYLLRYAAYAPPKVKRRVQDLAADNAIYWRSDLLRHRDLLQRGFWEPSLHRRFRDEGILLELDPRLQVTLCNRYSAGQFISQRLAYGLTRASDRPFLQRLFFALMAPGVFLILLGRILRTAWRNPGLRKQLASAWFWMPVFLAAWVWGETSGYLISLRARQA